MTSAAKAKSARSGERKHVLVRATLHTPEGAHPIWIRDISRTGTNIGGSDRLPCKCDVIVQRGSMFAAGRIAWTKGTDAGVEFYRELSEAEVGSALVPVPAGGH